MKKGFLLLSLSLFLCVFQLALQAEGDFEQTPKLVVKGEASVFKPADQMEVSLGIVTTDENSNVALNENNKRMHQVIANLKALGLDESDYQTGHFRIQPIYRKPARNERPEEVHQVIDRYEVTNAIQIKTQKLPLADKIIGAAVQGGVNQVDQLNFNLNNPQLYRAEAIQLAAQNAISDAQALAGAAGVKLTRVLYLSLDHWNNFPHLPGATMMARAVAGNETPLEAGNVEIHATVQMTFEIGSGK